MNYLAHCCLADLTGTSITGSIMGDFVRGNFEGRFTPEIERGIRLHRRIDSFTDAHATVRAAKRRFIPPYRRYAGILIDVLFDHFLARQWDRFHALPLEEFADKVYVEMDAHSPLFGDRTRLSLDYMRTRNLLVSYRELRGVENALKGLSTRLTRANPLGEAGPVLLAQYDALQGDFDEFFPQLVTYAKDQVE
jgi:acyl carrier protein phosphodiesterase